MQECCFIVVICYHTPLQHNKFAVVLVCFFNYEWFQINCLYNNGSNIKQISVTFFLCDDGWRQCLYSQKIISVIKHYLQQTNRINSFTFSAYELLSWQIERLVNSISINKLQGQTFTCIKLKYDLYILASF